MYEEVKKKFRFCIANCQISCAHVINVNKQELLQQCGKAIAATRNRCRNNKYAKDFTAAHHHIQLNVSMLVVPSNDSQRTLHEA